MKPYGEQQQAGIPGMVPLPQQQSPSAYPAPTGGYVPQQQQGYVPQQGYAPQQGYPPQQAPQQGYLAPGQPMGYPPPPQPQMGYAPQPQYGQPQYAQGPAPGMYAQPGQAYPGQPGMQQPGNDIVMVPQTSGCCCCEETKMVPMRTGGAMGNPMYGQGQQGMYQPQPMYGRQQQGGGGAGMAMGVVGGVVGGMMLMDAMDGDLFD